MNPDEIRAMLDEILKAVGQEPPVSIEVDVDGDVITMGDFKANMDWQKQLHDEFKKHDWSWLMVDGE
jgi:hypothetical protein